MIRHTSNSWTPRYTVQIMATVLRIDFQESKTEILRTGGPWRHLLMLKYGSSARTPWPIKSNRVFPGADGQGSMISLNLRIKRQEKCAGIFYLQIDPLESSRVGFQMLLYCIDKAIMRILMHLKYWTLWDHLPNVILEGITHHFRKTIIKLNTCIPSKKWGLMKQLHATMFTILACSLLNACSLLHLQPNLEKLWLHLCQNWCQGQAWGRE